MVSIGAKWGINTLTVLTIYGENDLTSSKVRKVTHLTGEDDLFSCECKTLIMIALKCSLFLTWKLALNSSCNWKSVAVRMFLVCTDTSYFTSTISVWKQVFFASTKAQVCVCVCVLRDEYCWGPHPHGRAWTMEQSVCVHPDWRRRQL